LNKKLCRSKPKEGRMSYDLQIINGDLVINNGELQTVQDTAKLTQDILKILLTEVGADPLQPSYGSYLSRSVIGNALTNGSIVQIAKSQINTCLTNLQQLQQLQVKSMQKVSADEQLAAITNISVTRSAYDPRLFIIKVGVLTKGYGPVTTSFTLSTI
jgi:phage baseplate assembly protein W